MPLKLRGSLSKSIPRKRDSITKALHPCPSCASTQQHRALSTRRNNHHDAVSSPRLRAEVQSQAQLQNLKSHPQSLASSKLFSTAPSTIHTARHVPPRLRELYESLAHIPSVAPEQVNISRLQLALRGLESEDPLIRVAGRFYSFHPSKFWFLLAWRCLLTCWVDSSWLKRCFIGAKTREASIS
jgi:hypothetical protein